MEDRVIKLSDLSAFLEQAESLLNDSYEKQAAFYVTRLKEFVQSRELPVERHDVADVLGL